MQKLWLLTGAALGGLSVMIGAFAAHALRPTLEATGRLDTFETAVKYQFYHALALLLVGGLRFFMDDRLLGWAGAAFAVGVFIFSGSLYVLCLSGVRAWGAVTPFGGVALIVGWVLLLIAVAKHPFETAP